MRRAFLYYSEIIMQPEMEKPSPFLFVIVAVAGAAVLALEILGTRILGPHFGVSLFLWSALITVTLAALSAGYLAGGAWADRAPAYTRLCLLPALAGGWIAAVPWIHPAVIGMTAGWEVRTGILVSASILFFPPLAVLGAVTPYAVRLAIADLGSAGRITGRLFAISTIASVVSALLTGFWLIPCLGILLLTTALGAVLLLTAAAGYLTAARGAGRIGRTAAAGLLALIGAGAAALSPSEGPDPGRGLVAVRQSPYGEIRIFDSGRERHFLIDRGLHSRVDTASGRSTLYYTAIMELPMRYFPRPGRMLLIGLGGGSLVRSYAGAGWTVDVVEIDPEVIAMAGEYFGLRGGDGRVFEADGRRYLAGPHDAYDVVLLDAYGSSAIPFHLVTAEAFQLVRRALGEDGLLAVNVIALGWRDPLVLDIAATLGTAFPRVLALPMAEPPDRVGNLVLLAGARDLEAVVPPEGNLTLDPEWRFGPGYALVHGWDNRFVPDVSGRRPVTDDLNAVDVTSERTMAAMRAEMLDYFGRLGPPW